MNTQKKIPPVVAGGKCIERLSKPSSEEETIPLQGLRRPAEYPP